MSTVGIQRFFNLALVILFGMSWGIRVNQVQAQSQRHVGERFEVRGSCAHEDLGETAPSLLHVRQLPYPGISSGDWLDEILVGSDGSFVWELDEFHQPTLFELSAPPWSWIVVVRPNEPCHLDLSPGKQARGLYGASGFSNWSGSHPSNVLDSLMAQQRLLNGQLAASVMLKMNGVVLAEDDSTIQQERLADESFEGAWSHAGEAMEEPWELDLWWHSKLSWMVARGSTNEALDSVWATSGMASDFRTNQEKLQSAGWLSAWRQVYGSWWMNDELDWDAINAAVFLANRDSLERAMNQVLDPSNPEALELAWLDMAIVQPSKVVERVWESIAMGGFYQDLHKELLRARRKGRFGWTPEPISWVLPNGDLDSLSGQCLQPWKILLVVKDGSSAAAREREYFNALIKEADCRELCAFVVSIDSNEEGWSTTVSGRKSINEEVVWIGNNPQVFEDYGIEAVPTVIAINGAGELSRQLSRLPSAGLSSELKQFVKKH